MKDSTRRRGKSSGVKHGGWFLKHSVTEHAGHEQNDRYLEDISNVTV